MTKMDGTKTDLDKRVSKISLTGTNYLFVNGRMGEILRLPMEYLGKEPQTFEYLDGVTYGNGW